MRHSASTQTVEELLKEIQPDSIVLDLDIFRAALFQKTMSKWEGFKYLVSTVGFRAALVGVRMYLLMRLESKERQYQGTDTQTVIKYANGHQIPLIFGDRPFEATVMDMYKSSREIRAFEKKQNLEARNFLRALQGESSAEFRENIAKPENKMKLAAIRFRPSPLLMNIAVHKRTKALMEAAIACSGKQVLIMLGREHMYGFAALMPHHGFRVAWHRLYHGGVRQILKHLDEVYARAAKEMLEEGIFGEEKPKESNRH